MALEEARRPTDEEQLEERPLLCEDELPPAGLSTDADERRVVEKSRSHLALTNEKLPPSGKDARDADKGLAFSHARTGQPRARPRYRAAKWTCFCLLLVAGILVVHTGAYRTMWMPLCARPGPRPPLPPTNSSAAMVPPPSGSAAVALPPYHNTTSVGAPTPRPHPSAIHPPPSAGRPGPSAAPRSGPRYRDSVALLGSEFGYSELWVWSRTRNNTLARRAMQRPEGAAAMTWEDGGAGARPFLGVPVVADAFMLGMDAHIAFAVEAATGDMVYAVWQGQDGWQAWTSLVSGGPRFVYQPTVAFEGVFGITVLAAAADGYLWANKLVQSYPRLVWGGWRVVAGGFVGEIALARAEMRKSRENPVYLVGLKDGQYQAAMALRGPRIYHELGVPGPCGGAEELGWPRLLEQGSSLLVFVACAGHVWAKNHAAATGAWDAEWRVFGDGPPGLRHLAHGQVATSTRLLSRAADGCVYHIGLHGVYGRNQPLWDPWQKLWCPATPRNLTGDDARSLSLSVSERPGSLVNVLIEDVDGKLYYNRLLSISIHSDHTAYTALPFEPVERPE